MAIGGARARPNGRAARTTMNFSVPLAALKSPSPRLGTSFSARAARRHIAAQLVSSSEPSIRWRTILCSNTSPFALSLSRPSPITQINNCLSRSPPSLVQLQLRPLHSSPSRQFAAEGSVIPHQTIMGSIPDSAPVVRVFIAGGSYAGLSAAVNLLDLGHGLSPRMAHERYQHHPSVPKVDFQITIADERDGYCEKFPLDYLFIFLNHLHTPCLEYEFCI